MNITHIKLLIQAKCNAYCLKTYGFLPSNTDITQKLHKLDQITNRSPVNMSLLKEHIIKTIREDIKQIYPIFREQVIQAEIDKIKRNSKILSLP